MDDVFTEAEQYLPSYLRPEDQSALFEELKKFPKKTNYFSEKEELKKELLQGDGWKGFGIRKYISGDFKQVSGMIISNSCDIAAENKRNFGPNILFAPLIPLSSTLELLRTQQKKAAQIDSFAESVRSQRVTSIFYLPSYRDAGERIVFLDRIYPQPLDNFDATDPLFTLSQAGFWVLLLKLSIHFSRFGEAVVR